MFICSTCFLFGLFFTLLLFIRCILFLSFFLFCRPRSGRLHPREAAGGSRRKARKPA
uniref:Uncharacterized protein n=1 Tax=Siphoviridae sp. ctf8W5 TaxID=2825595 RepID=A0A8S5Q6N9_9CAUD|nr:MAG TPA: protein of unknown function (DUF4094) [Siphoviridae sp. ctf8W5]